MIANQLDEIKQQKNYYRDNLRRAVAFLFFWCFVIILLITLILYEFFTQPEPYYYATSSDGRLVQLLVVPKNTGLIIRSNTQ